MALIARPTVSLCSTPQAHQARAYPFGNRSTRCYSAQPDGPESATGIEKCPTCGVPRNEMAFGCDGSGRIAGGIGAVPGFQWWPIKAYRPCGKATSAGIAYQRKGQIVDEVLFGRGKGN